MPSSPHPYRAAAHQLQHPEHASYSPSPRSTPLYSSAARSSRSYRAPSDPSSPEPFSEHERTKNSAHDYYASASAHTPNTSSRLSVSSSGPSAQQSAPSASKRRKRSHDHSAAPTSSNSPPKPSVADAHAAEPNDSKPSTRVAKACQPCSTKKRRCDGRQPQCSVCQVLGTPCTYNHTGLKRGPPKGFRSGPKESARAKLIRTLETTIRDLVNHLGKDDAGAEIIRVSGDRELQLSRSSQDQTAHPSFDDQGRRRSKFQRDDRRGAASRVKIEHLASIHPHSSDLDTNRPDSDAGPDENAEAEEDVIGETRQGELVYRGSSSGIGILQRHHRADSPSGGGGMTANRSVTSNSSAPFGGRSRDDRGPADIASHAKAPAFYPITSPRPLGDADTASSVDRSPRAKSSPMKDSSVNSLYPPARRESHASAQQTSADDPIVSPEENDRLFRYYWQGFHPFYPILYKPWFVRFSGHELRANLEPSLLYAIYAIGACVVPGNVHTSSTSKKPARGTQTPELKLNLERAQLFCQAAERRIFAKGLRPDIASIQACWLLSLYSHGTGDLSRAWNFENLACSMAVDMGLHRWPIYRPEIVQDRVQRETRIRIIWHCYIFDKLLCAEMGRPVGLRAKDIDVPLLSETEEDEFELWSDQTEMQPVGESGDRQVVSSSRRLHAPSCLNWGVHLFKIVERILDEVHSLRRKALLRRQGKEQVLADLDRQLTDWNDKLPAHLHLDDGNTNEGPFPSFFALNLWYYTARLLLHRPFIPQEEGVSLSKVLSNPSHHASTLAANTICDLLEASSRDIVDRLSTDLGYCLFTAAVMFVFNARLPDEKVAADARRRYGLCMQWLKKLADTWPAASAHRMLLDGFAVVGGDASKEGVEVGRRRMSIAPGVGSTTKVSNWIAETEGALQDPSSSSSSSSSSSAAVASADMAAAQSNVQGGLDDSMQAFANAWGATTPNFAPGIFDVESFFWNENAAATNVNFNHNSQNNHAVTHQPAMQEQIAYSGFMDGFAMPYQPPPPPAAAAQKHSDPGALVAASSAFGLAGAGPSHAQGQGQGLGEFWSMLELPPAFLQ